MTPIGMGKSPADIAQKKQLQRSKVSEDLKQEIINDLANKRYRKDGSRKVLKRNTSSQFSNYFERRMSNIAMTKLNNATPSEQSARKVINEVSQFTSNIPVGSVAGGQLLVEDAARAIVAG